jgi:predicted dehydrogenase
VKAALGDSTMTFIHQARSVDRSGRIGVVIVGCGYWGRNYARVLGELPQSYVAAVCDESLDRLGAIATAFPTVPVTNDLDQALALPGVQAAVVATPPSAHLDVATRCLSQDVHVLVEKPMTTSSEDAESLIALADQRGLTLMVGHTFIYNAGVRKLKEYLDSGAIGRLYYLYARRTNLGPIRTDVNAVWDLAPHDISIFEYLLGSAPEWVSAIGASLLCEGNADVGFVSLMYPNGIAAHMHLSWADPNKTREVVVVGSEKRIVFNDLDPLERVRVFDKGVSRVASEPSTFGEFTFLQRDGDILSPMVEASEPLKNECEHFIECVRTRERPLTDGRAGQRVIQVIEAIDESVRANGVPSRGPAASTAPTQEVVDASSAVAIH